jgi:hypothetical protein
MVLSLAIAGVERLKAPNGEVAEWSKAHAWKVCRRETVSRVRIPVSPPIYSVKTLNVLDISHDLRMLDTFPDTLYQLPSLVVVQYARN